MRNNFGGETGRVAEGEYFGYVSKEKYGDYLRNESRFNRLSASHGEAAAEKYEAMSYNFPPYIDTRSSFELVKTLQKVGPLTPEKPFARDLRKKIVELLRKEINFIVDNRVEYYTTCSDLIVNGETIDTAADQYHGTDAFFIIKTKEKGDFILRLDGSKRPDKERGKSDMAIIWPRDLDDKEDPKGFAEFVHYYAQEAVGLIVKKYKDRVIPKSLTQEHK